MSEIKKTTKKKNRRLVVQMSIITFALFLASMTVISLISIFGSYKLYYETKTNSLRNSAEALKTLVFVDESTEWLLEYLDRNGSDMEWFLDADDDADKKGIEALYNAFSIMESEGSKTLKTVLEKLDEEDQRNLAVYLTDQFFTTALMQIENKDYDNIFIINISSEGYGQFYLNDTENMEEQLSIDDDKTIQRLRNSTEKETFGETVFDTVFDDGMQLLSYTPIYSQGKPKAVLVLRNDCDDYVSILWNNLLIMLLWGVISLLITDALIVLFVYRKAIRPLATVKKAVLDYKSDKDSAKAAEKMQKVRVRNEIGVLADSFSEMTGELDSYMTENLRLTSERERVAAELEMAAEIQLDMLPKEFPSSAAFELYASMDPAKEVGGDFYDFFMIDEDHLALVIADVSGKGMPAALFMMKSKIIIKENALSGGTPARIIEKANNAICENNDAMMFVTVWLGILELSTGKLTAANAGHEYPIIRQPDGGFELFKDKHGISLGMRKNRTFKEYELTLQKGSTLFVYTDGAPEAANGEETLYGTDRLLEALNREPDSSPQKLIDDVHKAVDEFVGDAPQFDDLTMLCVKIKE